MQLKKIFGITAIIFTLSACTQLKVTSDEEINSQQLVQATAWYQTAGETKALYYQGYNLGKNILNEKLKEKSDKPYSIVLDLDETVIDNSPYQVENIRNNKGFSFKNWNHWVNMKKAKAVPGAKEFLKFANDNGVEIYYISDRLESQLDATIENLKKIGIPVQGKDHVLLKNSKDKSGKVNRRNIVKEKTNLVLLFGDNLSDFDVFSKSSIKDRNLKVEELKKEFGEKFIILPNPMYGSFEKAIFDGKYPTTDEKIKSRERVLEGY